MTLLGKVLALGASFFAASAISGVVGAFVGTASKVTAPTQESKPEVSSAKGNVDDDIDPGAIFA